MLHLGGPAASLDGHVASRVAAGQAFFAAEAERLARACHRMAERFARGGRLLAVAATPSGRSDAHHVAVEFVHPVIVGKRALPALAITDGQPGGVAGALDRLAGPDDIVMAFGAEEDGGEAVAALATARTRGCLTVAFAPAGAEWEFVPPSEDRYVRQELVETAYHVLWELVHVFFEHRGLLAGRTARRTHDAGASTFLYPFLGEDERDLDEVVADVRRSAEAKAEAADRLRAQTVADGAAALAAAAGAARARLVAGGKVLALGNGGSATDAMDLVADLGDPRLGTGHGRAWAAIDLTADSSVITAVANDIGTEAIFSRQVIALGAPGDLLVALSTSGNSLSVLSALAEARRREIATVAFVGYDGGRVVAESLADHAVVTRSEHIPRIQEAQATAYHTLRELIEGPGFARPSEFAPRANVAGSGSARPSEFAPRANVAGPRP